MSIRDRLKLSAVQIGVAAGVLGGVTGLALVGVAPVPAAIQLASDEAAGDISGPCDEAENADKPECAGVTVPGPTSTTSPTTSTTVPDGPSAPAPGETLSVDAAGAGTVTYQVVEGGFELIAATPSDGWTVEVEQGAGIEIDVDFRSGSQRVQVDIEFEDGGVRERVRVRDDATGGRIEITNGQVTEVRDGDGGRNDDRRDDDRRDDRSDDDGRPDNSGPGSADDSGRDNSGPGSGDDDRDDDRRDNSGSGNADDRDDDRRDNSGSGNDDRDDDRDDDDDDDDRDED